MNAHHQFAVATHKVVARVHGLGQQLLQLSHPFAQPACLMYPALMFSYRDWAAKLSASKCLQGSKPAVTPGAYKGFTY